MNGPRSSPNSSPGIVNHNTSPFRGAVSSLLVRKDSVWGANISPSPARVPGAFERENGNIGDEEDELDAIDSGDEGFESLGSASSRGVSPEPERVGVVIKTTPSLVAPSVLAAASKLLSSDDDLPGSPVHNGLNGLHVEPDPLAAPDPAHMSQAAFRAHMVAAMERLEKRMGELEARIREDNAKLDVKLASLPASAPVSPVASLNELGSPTTPTQTTMTMDRKQKIVQTGSALILSFFWTTVTRIAKQIATFIYLRRLRKIIITVLFTLTVWAHRKFPGVIYDKVLGPLMDFIFRIL